MNVHAAPGLGHNVRTIELDYAPRVQFRPFHNREHRWACLVCHRRAGKTVASVNDIVRRAVMEAKPDGRYAFIAPYYNQAKDLAWTYLKRYSLPLQAEPPRESELSVTLIGGQRIRLYGGDNPDRLRGGYLDGVVLDEFGDMVPALWADVIRPQLADRHGWATIIGTPKGKNAFWDVWKKAQKNEEWYTMMLRASESGIVDKAELDDALKVQGPDQYAQEFECSFEAAIKGAFYADEMRIMAAEGRIRPLEIDKAVRVHTAWDLGISDATAIWFIQAVGRERRFVDYYEASGVGLDHYARILFDKRMQHGWQYGEHYFPHDIKQRELIAGKSRQSALADYHIEANVVPQHNVLDGINVVRRMLGRALIDPDRCERGIEALRQYRREWDENLKDYKKNAMHDWTSHGADAVRYFAAGFDDPASVPPSSDRRRGGDASTGSPWAA